MRESSIFKVLVCFGAFTCFFHKGLASDNADLAEFYQNSLTSQEFREDVSKSHAGSPLGSIDEKTLQYYQTDPRPYNKKWHNSVNVDYGYQNYVESYGFQDSDPPKEESMHLHKAHKYDFGNHRGIQTNLATDKQTNDIKKAIRLWNKNRLLWKTKKYLRLLKGEPKESPYDLATVDTGGWRK